MLIPNFGQFSVHSSFGTVINNAYLHVPGLDHVCVTMDKEGRAKSVSIYVPTIKMFFESRK